MSSAAERCAELGIARAVQRDQISKIVGFDTNLLIPADVKSLVETAIQLHRENEGTTYIDVAQVIGINRFNKIIIDAENRAIQAAGCRPGEDPSFETDLSIKTLREASRRRQQGGLLAAMSEAFRKNDSGAFLAAKRELDEFLESETQESGELFTSLGEFPDTFDEMPHLIERLLPTEALVFWAGLPKSRKSTLAALSLVCVAGGVDFLGHAVCVPSVALYVSCEESADVVVLRFRKLIRGLCLPAEVEDQIARNLRICCGETWLLDLPEFQAKFEAQLKRHQPRYAVLDPMVAIRGADVDENSARGLEPLLTYLRAVRLRHKMAVGVVHHSSKGVESSPSQETFLRGTGASAASYDVLVGSTKLGDDGLQNLLYIFSRHAPPSRLVTTWRYSDIARSIEVEVEAPAKQPSKAESVDIAFEVERLLSEAPTGLTVRSLATSLKRSNQAVKSILETLQKHGRAKTQKGRTFRTNGQPYTTDLWFTEEMGGQGELQYDY